MEDFMKYEPFFGSWKIVKKIGEGAFGKVFEVERSDFGKSFKSALKVVSIPANNSEVESLTSEGMDEESVKRYFNSMAGEMINEFELLSKLQGNSYIVSYDDHMVNEKESGFGYDIIIRMELLTPISTKLVSGEMPQEDVLQMGIDICKALEICEKYHIVHRDIKPENIFLSDIGTYKLGDFGVARTMENDNHVLSRKGTQSYMAPELYKEEAANQTVDIYSLGIVLYRLCNKNRLPFMPPFPQEVTFTDREIAMKKRIMGDPMPKPSEAIDPFASIILKACAYRIGDRYQNAYQMRKDLEALQRCLNGEEVHMPAPQEGPGLHDDSYYTNKSQRSSVSVHTGMPYSTNGSFSQRMPYMTTAGSRSNGPMPNNGMRPNGPMPNNGIRPNGPMPNNGMRPNGPMPNNGMRPNGPMSNNGMRPNGPMPNNGIRPNGPMPNNGMRPNGPIPNNGMRPNGPIPNNGMRPNGPMPNNGMRPNGPMPNNGMRPNGPMPNGTMRPNGPMPNNGMRPNGPMPNGTMRPNGPMPNNGPRPNGPMPNGTMRPGGPMPNNNPGPNGSVPNSTMRSAGPMPNGPTTKTSK